MHGEFCYNTSGIFYLELKNVMFNLNFARKIRTVAYKKTLNASHCILADQGLIES